MINKHKFITSLPIIFFISMAILALRQPSSGWGATIVFLCISIGLFLKSNFTRRIAAFFIVIFMYFITQLFFAVFALKEELLFSDSSDDMRLVYFILIESALVFVLYALKNRFTELEEKENSLVLTFEKIKKLFNK